MKSETVRAKVGTDFTQGNILEEMIRFGLPLLLSSFLQHLYNAVDTMVIGRFEGTVGTVGVANGGEIASVITFVAMAFGNAGQIYISQLCGAKDHQGIKESTGTLVSMTFLMSVIFGAFSIIFCRPLLGLLNTQEAAMQEAMRYMIIVSLGLPAVFGYNAICGILRGLGESAKPLIFISVATVTNIVLDLLLVAVIPLAAAGTAIATIFAQYASFIASLIFLYKRKERFGLDFSLGSFRVNGSRMMDLLRLGIPLTVQSALIHLTQLYCNAQINSFGLVPSATNSIGNKIYRILHVGTTSISTSTSTMIGQNLGAGNHKRAKQVVFTSLKCCAVLGLFEIFVALFLPRQIFGLFIEDPEVIEYGVTYMRVICIACVLCILQTPFQGMVTGSGNAKLAFIAGMLDGVIIRLGVAIPLSAVLGATGYFIGNNVAHLGPVTVGMVYFFSGKWKDYKLLNRNKK